MDLATPSPEHMPTGLGFSVMPIGLDAYRLLDLATPYPEHMLVLAVTVLLLVQPAFLQNCGSCVFMTLSLFPSLPSSHSRVCLATASARPLRFRVWVRNPYLKPNLSESNFTSQPYGLVT
jgi:hypothetical protein